MPTLVVSERTLLCGYRHVYYTPTYYTRRKRKLSWADRLQRGWDGGLGKEKELSLGNIDLGFVALRRCSPFPAAKSAAATFTRLPEATFRGRRRLESTPRRGWKRPKAAGGRRPRPRRSPGKPRRKVRIDRRGGGAGRRREDGGAQVSPSAGAFPPPHEKSCGLSPQDPHCMAGCYYCTQQAVRT